MKNKKFINSFNNIVPTQKEKDIILHKILNRDNKKNSFHYFKVAFIYASIIFIFILNINQEKDNNIATLNIRSTPDININYKNKCYKYGQRLNNNNNLNYVTLFPFLDNDFIQYALLYETNNKLILKINEEYIEIIEKKCFTHE